MIELLYHNQKGDKQIVADKEWKKQLKIQDIRSAILTKIAGLNYTDVGIMVYFLKLGTYFCVFRQIKTDRPLDNHAIWVFVPKDDDVQPSDLKRLLTQVMEKVKEEPPYEENSIRAFSEDVERLGYNVEVGTTKRPVFLSADNKKIACRYYCDEKDSLFDVLRDLYQPEYERYEAVLLLDEHSNLRGGLDVNDLTGHDLVGQEMIDPSEIKSQLPPSVEVYYEGYPMNGPAFVPQNGFITIELRRKGYKPISLSFSKGQIIKSLDWKVRVSREVFEVRCMDEKIGDYTLIINGNYVDDYVDLTEAEARKASFRIEKAGYKLFKKESENFLGDLSCNRRVLVELKKLAQVPSSGGGNGGMSSRGRFNGTAGLQEDRLSFLRDWLFWVLMATALLLGGIVGYQIHRGTPKEKTSKKEVTDPKKNGNSTEGNENQNEQNGGQVSTGGNEDGEGIGENQPVQGTPVEYLNTHDKWNKQEMESIPELKGFWDMLNTYDIEAMTQEPWSSKLSKSNRYKQVIAAFGTKTKKDFSGTYNNSGDNDITVSRYLERVKNHAVIGITPPVKPKDEGEEIAPIIEETGTDTSASSEDDY